MSHKYTLYINPTCNNNELINYYLMLELTCANSHDSGIDLYIPDDININRGVKSVNHMIRCYMVDNMTNINTGYYLSQKYSTINEYPNIIINTNIIDATYRGHIISYVRKVDMNMNITINAESKLFQICAPDLSTLKIKVIRPSDDFIFNNNN